MKLCFTTLKRHLGRSIQFTSKSKSYFKNNKNHNTEWTDGKVKLVPSLIIEKNLPNIAWKVNLPKYGKNNHNLAMRRRRKARGFAGWGTPFLNPPVPCPCLLLRRLKPHLLVVAGRTRTHPCGKAAKTRAPYFPVFRELKMITPPLTPETSDSFYAPPFAT